MSEDRRSEPSDPKVYSGSTQAVAPDGSIACFSNKVVRSLLGWRSLAAGEQQR